jgi:hypothetical protein
MDIAVLRAVAWNQNHSIGGKFREWAEIFSGKLEISGGQKVRGLAVKFGGGSAVGGET